MRPERIVIIFLNINVNGCSNLDADTKHQPENDIARVRKSVIKFINLLKYVYKPLLLATVDLDILSKNAPNHYLKLASLSHCGVCVNK